MTKFTKYLIVIVTILLMLLAIPFFVSIDSYKSIIAEKVRQHTGRDLKMDGEITFAILPTPQIKMANLKLSSLPGAKAINLIEIDAIKAKLLLPPLLSGKIVIANLELIKPVINLEKLANGNGTWEVQLDRPTNETPEKTADTEATSSSSLVSINDIRIKNGKLQYIEKDRVITIDNLDLNIVIPTSGKPEFDLDMSLAAINLNTLPIASEASSSSRTTGGGRWSKSKIDLSLLDSANGTINLKIPKIISGSLVLNNLMIKAKLTEGNLNLSSFNAGLYGGLIEGKGSVSNHSQYPATLSFALKNAKLSNIVSSGSKIKITDGVINLSGQLQSEGSSQFAYISNLNGNVSLTGKDGKVSGIDLQKIIHSLNKPRDLAALGRNIESGIGRGETLFSNLSAQSSITKGIMKINQCELTSNETSIITTGQVNLPQFSLDSIATVNSGVKNFPPVKIRLYGSLNNPQHKVDIKAIWQYLAKNALTGVIDSIKQGKTNPKDLLEGLLDAGERSNTNSSDSSEEVRQDPNNATQKLLQKGLKGLFK